MPAALTVVLAVAAVKKRMIFTTGCPKKKLTLRKLTHCLSKWPLRGIYTCLSICRPVKESCQTPDSGLKVFRTLKYPHLASHTPLSDHLL